MKKCILTILLLIFSQFLFSQDNIYNSTVEFIINTDKFIENENYKSFIGNTLPFIANNKKEIESILIIGNASPEGNKKANEVLANKRSNKVFLEISKFIQKDKIFINNDYQLFLSKTGLNERDYLPLRAVYIEIKMKPVELDVGNKIDTVYIEKNIVYRDAVIKYNEVVRNNVASKSCNKLILSLNNNLATDLLKTYGVGIEFYMNKWSLFIEGNFANTTIVERNFNFDLWHTGIRKYFNNDYNKMFIELYCRTGYFDIDVFNDNCGKFGVPFGIGFGAGYKFDLCNHVKIYPFLRLGYDYVRFMDYYTDNSGDIEITFNNYTDYRNNGESSENSQKSNFIGKEDRVINKDFFEKSKTLHWFGPTYIGLIIQVDFHKKNNK